MSREELYYELVAVKGTGAASRYRMQVIDEEIVPEEQVLNEMHEFNPQLTPEQYAIAMEALSHVIAHHAGKGRGVRTRVIETSHGIEGTTEQDGEYSPAHNHSIHLTARAGRAAQEAAAKAKTHKVPQGRVGPLILGVTDLTTKSTNDKITLDGYIRVTGDRIELAGPQAAAVFMLHGEAPFPANLSKVLVNKPSELLILVPNGMIVNQWYELQITTHFSSSGGRLLKTPHTTIFDTRLTAVAPASHDDGEPVI